MTGIAVALAVYVVAMTVYLAAVTVILTRRVTGRSRKPRP